ncbi:MAG: bifunctional sulfate adenylyltransferase/adenylylsulfate kinase [Rhodothermales bacterium]|nr:bifunctional sulfate adenylyltransferase/adenylylsulfate kinase [Rhodothermales bacterium]
MDTATLIEPHGGKLCDLIATGNEADALRKEALDLPSITLTPRQLCDIELLLNGGFSPLEGFLTEAEYDSVVANLRLTDGTIWPMPITLDVDEDTAKGLNSGDRVALRDQTGLLLAVMTAESVWKPNKEKEANGVFGTSNVEHPAVNYLMNHASDYYIGGKLEGVSLPKYYDFEDLRQTPRELRAQFEKDGWTTIVAFQTRNPMHRAHKELTDRAAEEIGGHLLIHPVVGMTKPGDIDYYTRVRCYRKLMDYYPKDRAELSLLPLAMRMGGPREAVWHAIIRKNYGCTHIVIGRDHAGPGSDSKGNPFYGPYEAQDLILEHADELGMGVVPFKLMVYAPDIDGYKPIDEVAEGEKTLSISGTELRRRLATGEEIPNWFSYKEVVQELRKSHPPKNGQGVTVFFTGLSGSGKSTVANAVMVKLLEMGGRPVTLLDGDVVRTHLTKGLGFSAEDRSTNVQRIGYVASEITKHRGIAICAPIAPYEADRKVNRNQIGQFGAYIEAYVSTSLEECERRDVKGLYAKARAGLIKGFTGIDDPYEAPTDAEIVIDTSKTVDECAQDVIDYLRNEGYIA